MIRTSSSIKHKYKHTAAVRYVLHYLRTSKKIPREHTHLSLTAAAAVVVRAVRETKMGTQNRIPGVN